MKNKSIILLSGGLDSVVSLAIHKEDVKLAILFDYGQKALNEEIKASKEIAKFYNIEHKIITLDWLKEISTSSLNTNEEIPELTKDSLNDKTITESSAKSVWVPNRNALFINIAACFCDANNYNSIIIGANKEEGETFKDNSSQFIEAINESLKNSTNNNVKVLAPLINYTKEEIVKIAIEKEIPFNLLYSCYSNKEKHCGKCESCLRLKRALELNNRQDIISTIF
jgi:7-cyano-7-deazaguanine synthase